MSVIRSAVVLLVTLLPATAQFAQPLDSLEGYKAALTQARTALGAEDFPTALTQLDRAISLRSDAPAAFALLGQAYLRLERYPEASDALARAAELSGGTATPEGIEALNFLALSLAREERNVEALDLVNRLVAVSPRRPTVWLLRGNLHLALGQPSIAKSDFENEIRLHPGAGLATGASAPPRSILAAALEGRGICAYRLGDDALALDSLKRASDGLDARYHLAMTLARMQRHAEALETFESVIARDPGHRGALQGLMRSAASLGREDVRLRASSTLEALYRMDEEHRSAKIKASSLRTRALAKAAAGDARGACADLEQAVQVSPEDLELRLDLGRVLSIAGERRRGEEVLRTLIAQEALYAEAHYHLGKLLLTGDDPAAALVPFETASRIAPLNAAYHVALGQAYIVSRRLDEGLNELRLTRKLAPADPEIAYSLGLGLAEAGALPEAVEELESAASLAEADPRPHEALARLHARMGNMERSRREQEIFERLNARPSPPT